MMFYMIDLECRPHVGLWFFFSSRRRHTRSKRDWSSDVCSSDLGARAVLPRAAVPPRLPLRDGFRMLNILHAHTPPTRLSAMLTGRERAEHAARVVRAAEAGLLGADADPDRRDLAALLGAIGTALESTTRSAPTLGEVFRWSEACVLAERI